MFYEIINRELTHEKLGKITKQQIIYYELIDGEYVEQTRENYTGTEHVILFDAKPLEL